MEGQRAGAGGVLESLSSTQQCRDSGDDKACCLQVEINEGCCLPLCFEDVTACTGGDGKGGKNGKKYLVKSPKGMKGSKVPKQSQAAELEIGAGVALVGMVGLVTLVATKLRASVAVEDEGALLAVP
eukprot:gene7250-5460_t